MKLLLLFGVFSLGAVAAPTKDPLNEFFKDKTKIERPFDLRDPFKAPTPVSDNKDKKKGFTMTEKGKYTNLKEETIDKVQDIKVVGVLIGKERRALVTNQLGKSVIILKEGMKIGEDEAELKAILPGGIILVEKIINVYGQEEYLETVIPISK